MDTVLNREQSHRAPTGRHTTQVQEKLDHARVAVVGLGGLGSNVASTLARIGVGHLYLIDFDVVDTTNLNRQQYTTRHLGICKTLALAYELKETNPFLDIYTHCVRVTESNIQSLFEHETIICEVFDRPEAKATLANGILEQFPDKFLVSTSGMAGFGSGNSTCTKRAGRHFYVCEDDTSLPGSGNGLMAPRVMLCATHQVNMITRPISGEETV